MQGLERRHSWPNWVPKNLSGRQNSDLSKDVCYLLRLGPRDFSELKSWRLNTRVKREILGTNRHLKDDISGIW